MKDIILYLLQVNICICIFLFAYKFFLRNATFLKFNRIFLLSGLVASFIIPCFRFTYDIHINRSLQDMMIPENIAGPVQSQPDSVGSWIILFIVYICGVIVLSSRYLISLRTLYKLINTGLKSKTSGYTLIHHKDVNSPFTVFRYIFLNTLTISNTEKELILKHEISHVKQKHWIDLLCSECALMLLWFNPLLWLYISYLKENHEYMADRAVMKTGCAFAVYQAVLINQRFRGPVFSFSNSLNYSSHLNRLAMIKKAKSSSIKKIFVLMLIPVFGLFFKIFAEPNYIIQGVEPVVASDNTGKDSIYVKVIGYKGGQRTERDFSSIPSDVLYILDGQESTIEKVKGLDHDLVDNISVLKNKTAVEQFGDKGANGVIVIKTKNASTSVTSLNNKNILLIVDGVEFNGKLEDIDSNDIVSVDVLKSQEFIEPYGDKGKNGVVLVKTKKYKK